MIEIKAKQVKIIFVLQKDKNFLSTNNKLNFDF